MGRDSPSAAAPRPACPISSTRRTRRAYAPSASCPCRGRSWQRSQKAAAGAEEHEPLVLREHRLAVGVRLVDPELQHAARAVESARHLALALELPRIALADDDDTLAPWQVRGLIAGRHFNHGQHVFFFALGYRGWF